MTTPELLSQIPLFENLGPEDLKDLSILLREQKVKKGDVLFRKKSEGNALYFIRQGAIKIVLPSRLGDERIVTIFTAGEFFGEMSLLDGMPRSADAVAVQASRVLILDRSDFLRFLKNNESAIEKILSTLSLRLRKTDELLEDLTFLNIPARFAKKLLEIGETFGQRDGDAVRVSLKLSQQELADMVGATRESINKELRVLREKGLVTVTDKNIHIHDINRLKRRIH
ncbi:Crp/Fnr family transcriptional regulator [Thermodesulfobacteriota bacterium]